MCAGISNYLYFFTCNRKIAHAPFYITGNRSRRYNMLFRPTIASKSLKEQHLKVKNQRSWTQYKTFPEFKICTKPGI